MNEYCILNDEGIIEDGFYSLTEAEARIAESYPDEDDLTVERRDLYDEDGEWIDEFAEDDEANDDV